MSRLDNFGEKSKENIKKVWSIIEYRIDNPIENPYPNDKSEAKPEKQIIHILGEDLIEVPETEMSSQIFDTALNNLEDVYDEFEIQKIHDYVNKPAPDAYKHESPHQGLEPSFAVLQMPENFQMISDDLSNYTSGKASATDLDDADITFQGTEIKINKQKIRFDRENNTGAFVKYVSEEVIDKSRNIEIKDAHQYIFGDGVYKGNKESKDQIKNAAYGVNKKIQEEINVKEDQKVFSTAKNSINKHY